MSNQKAIEEIIDLYFLGTYHGDQEKLRQAFHPDAHITGIFQNKYVDWTLEEFIKMVSAQRAAESEDVFDKKILSLDCEESMAMVKARVVVHKKVFIDFIILLKINEKWVIRNKSFYTE